MRNLAATILICFLGALSGWGAEIGPIDSLKNAIARAIDDTNKVWLIERLQRSYVAQNDYNASLEAAMAMLELSKRIGFGKGQGQSEAHVAYCYYFLGQYTVALNWVNKARISAEKWLSPHHVSTCWGNAGLVLQEMGQYDSAMVYLLECLKIREADRDTVHWAYTHYDIAELHIELGEFERAIEHHAKALALRKMIPNVIDDYNVIEDSYRALAMAFHRDGNNDSALVLLDSSLKINIEKKDIKRMAHTRRNTGEVLLSLGQYRSALEQLIQSNALDTSINNVENAAELHTLVGQAHEGLGDYNAAIASYEHAIDRALAMKLAPMEVKARNLLANALHASGQSNLAYGQLIRAQRAKDSLITEQKVKTLKELDVRYQTSKKEAQIDRLNADKDLAEAKQKFSNQLLIGTSVGLVFIIIAGFLLFIAYRQKQRINASLEQKNLENEALLKEIHHRVKNNLQVISSLLNLQSSSMEDGEAQSAIKEGQNRVKSIALIHQKLYQTEDISKVDFQDYVQQLTSFLESTFQRSDLKVDFEIDAKGLFLDIDTAVPLGLIINELVTNAYKYAFQGRNLGRIRITASTDLDGFLLIVSDNGVGLPSDFSIAKSKSLGMKLIHILSRQLRGGIEIEGDSGTTFRVTFQESRARAKTA